MKIKLIILITSSIFFAITIFSCKNSQSEKQKDTILTGTVDVFVDNTIFPIIEDEVLVFQNTYKGKINLTPKSEVECINALANKSTQIVVLSRKLTKNEKKIFNKSKITPKETAFATDGIAFITKVKNDTLINLDDVLNLLKNKPSKLKGLVFDNANSSTINYLLEKAQVKDFPKDKVFTLKNNEEVIQYIANNSGLVGVTAINWITQPSKELEKNIDNITIMYVQGKDGKYYYPSQENLITKAYPLARDLYIINAQGHDGLGVGFASFVAGQIGQRIVLKSGLAPKKVPGRNIIIRNSI